MINNNNQYRVSLLQLSRLTARYAGLLEPQAEDVGVDPRLIQAERDGVQSRIATLIGEIREYEQRTGTPHLFADQQMSVASS